LNTSVRVDHQPESQALIGLGVIGGCRYERALPRRHDVTGIAEPASRAAAHPFHLESAQWRGGIMLPAKTYIHRTALKLLRAYGARALSEARGWRRHFAESGEVAERLVWTRIAWEVRRHQRGALPA